MDKQLQLLNNKLFQGISADQIDRFADYVELITFEPKDMIVQQGIPTKGVYIIVQGSVNVQLQLFSDQQIQVVTLSKNHVFGEISLLDEGPATAFIYARTKCQCLLLSREMFHHIKHIYSDIYQTISQNIAMIVNDKIMYNLTEIKKLSTKSEIILDRAENSIPKRHYLKKITIPFLNRYQFLFDQISLFQNLSVREQRRLVKYLSYFVLNKDEVLFKLDQNDSDVFYLLVYGSIINYLERPKTILLGVNAPGTLCGHISYMNNCAPFCTSRIREDALLLAFERHQVELIKLEAPNIYRKIEGLLLQSITKSFRSLDKLILNIQIDENLGAT